MYDYNNKILRHKIKKIYLNYLPIIRIWIKKYINYNEKKNVVKYHSAVH